MHVVLLAVLSILLFLGYNGDDTECLRSKIKGQGDVAFDYEEDRSSSSGIPLLYPGELPGYTGWARPRTTVAADIHLKSSSWTRDDQWTIILQGDQLVWQNDPSFDCAKIKFYARAYGPAVSVGRIRYMEDEDDECSYAVDFPLYDPGPYYVEVVVTFSQVPAANLFPLDHKRDMDDPPYEGYMIHGFPLKVVQTKDPLDRRKKQQQVKQDNRTCNVQDLQMKNSQQELGRWVVTSKAGTMHWDHHREATLEDQSMTLESYQDGRTALAISMEYRLLESCVIPSHLSGKTGEKHHQVHVIFLGDSTMRLQYFWFRAHKTTFKGDTSFNLTLTYISNHDGMYEQMKNVTSEVSKAVKATKPGTEFVVMYNTGLHDIGRLCGSQFEKIRQKSKDTLLKHRTYSCLLHYKSLLGELTDFLLQTLPEHHRHVFFQTTTAGWPKWGNYGFGWPPNEGQVYTKSPEFCSEMNEAAFDVLRANKRAPHVTITDGYWITLARPDHREVNEDQYIGKHLVHPGPEVVDAMQRTVRLILYEVLMSEK